MAHKNVLITAKGKACKDKTGIHKGFTVTFFPADSTQTITITFKLPKGAPFSDWGSNTKRGTKGQPVTGLVARNAAGSYKYEPDSEPGRRLNKRGNPELIVEGRRAGLRRSRNR